MVFLRTQVLPVFCFSRKTQRRAMLSAALTFSANFHPPILLHQPRKRQKLSGDVGALDRELVLDVLGVHLLELLLGPPDPEVGLATRGEAAVLGALGLSQSPQEDLAQRLPGADLAVGHRELQGLVLRPVLRGDVVARGGGRGPRRAVLLLVQVQGRPQEVVELLGLSFLRGAEAKGR